MGNEQSDGAEELPFSLFSSKGNAALSLLGQALWALANFYRSASVFCVTISTSLLYFIILYQLHVYFVGSYTSGPM